MLVKERMTPNPITIQAKASIPELTYLMKENKLKKRAILTVKLLRFNASSAKKLTKRFLYEMV